MTDTQAFFFYFSAGATGVAAIGIAAFLIAIAVVKISDEMRFRSCMRKHSWKYMRKQRQL